MFHVNPLFHFAAISDSLTRLGLRGELHFDTFRFEVSSGTRCIELCPEFMSTEPGCVFYHDGVEPEVVAFAGWRAGPRRAWEASGDKLRFKAFCNTNRLLTPRIYGTGERGQALVLLKEKHKPNSIRSRSLRGRIEGPMPLAALGQHTPRDDLFAEEYIDGKSVEAWYFDGRLACADIRDKPAIKGDGKSTLRELIEASNFAMGVIPLQWHIAEALAALNDLSLDSLVPPGKTVPVDIAYDSPLRRFARDVENVLPKIAGTAEYEQLRAAGPVLWQAIPENVRTRALFSVRAVIDAQGNVWFTDLNIDRYVHPCTYTVMLTSLFGLPDPPLAQPVPAMAASPGTQ